MLNFYNYQYMKALLTILSVCLLLNSCRQSTKKESIQFHHSDTVLKSVQKQAVNEEKVGSEEKELIDTVEYKLDTLICENNEFKSAKAKADSLLQYFNEIEKYSGKKRLNSERKFFCTFPNSFAEMQELFGYDNTKGEAPLYFSPMVERLTSCFSSPNALISYFEHLNSIPKDKYYDKYINICVNGIWQADNIGAAFGFGERILKDTEDACLYLEKRSDSEIESIFKFIFDGPHPKNESNEEFYNKLLPEITSANERLGKLLTKSYKELISKDDGHGH